MTFVTKTILGIAIIQIALLMILVFSSISFLSTSNEKQLIQRANANASMFVHASTNAVLSMDFATIDDLVNDIMAQEDVLYVRITYQGKVLAVGGDNLLLSEISNVDQDLSSIDDSVFDIRVPIRENDIVYGHVDMGFGTSALKKMLAQAQKSIIGIASLEILLVVFFSFVLGTYLAKNLTRLTNVAHTLSKKGPGYELRLDRTDQLGDVADAFDDMSRNLEQSYQELRQARIEAENANESKSRFLASMSHEIRTPMNGVLGLLSLLEETKLTQEQQKLLKTATESGEFLLSIINDILDFSRMEANTLILERDAFDFHACVSNVVSSFEPLAKEKALILNCTIKPQVPEFVYGDANRYRQILFNLLANAFKFTPHGSVSVEIDAKKTSDQRFSVSCAVIDTGVGIEQEAQSYLFDEFTMVDQTYSRSQEGSGLGLAICKRLAFLMDGEISVSSTVDVGSRFEFQVSLETSAQPLVPVNHNHRNDDLPESILAARVLVAEDNKANQLVIKNLFSHAGINIDLAENGQQALELIQLHDYDIVFMDISMPEMDGIEACQHIRLMTDEAKAQLPIVALTAHALSGDKENFLGIGMTDYLSKPVRKNQLIDVLYKYLLPNGEIATIPHIVSKGPSSLTSHSVEDESLMKEHLAMPIEMKPTATKSAKAMHTEPSLNNHSLDAHKLEARPDNEDDIAIVDEAILEQMIEDTSLEVLPILVEHYIEETNLRVDKVIQALSSGDSDALEFESHTLGSASLALGNRKLSDLARAIEKECREGDAAKALTLGKELPELAKTSLAALVKYSEQKLAQG